MTKLKKTEGAENNPAPAKKRASKKATTKKAKAMTITDLAAALSITRKTIHHLRNTADAPASTDFDEWKAFLEARAADLPVAGNEQHQSEDMATLRKRLLRAQAGKEEANRRLKELQLEQTELGLVPMGEAKAAIRRTLGPLRELLDTLPKAVALQANPAEPVHAEEAVREGLDRIFRMMEEATPIDE
jgi:hypothetical protein